MTGVVGDVSLCHLPVGVTDMHKPARRGITGARSTYEMHRGVALRLGPTR